MMEICDNRDDIVHVLCEKANTATPKDLALWEDIPDLLMAEAGIGSGEIMEETVKEWCLRAKIVLDSLEWVHWFATPVS